MPTCLRTTTMLTYTQLSPLYPECHSRKKRCQALPCFGGGGAWARGYRGHACAHMLIRARLAKVVLINSLLHRNAQRHETVRVGRSLFGWEVWHNHLAESPHAVHGSQPTPGQHDWHLKKQYAQHCEYLSIHLILTNVDTKSMPKLPFLVYRQYLSYLRRHVFRSTFLVIFLIEGSWSLAHQFPWQWGHRISLQSQ